MRALFKWIQIVGLSASAVAGTVAAQQPGREPAHPSNSKWAACCGYNYNYAGVCLFSEMVAGYSLPVLDDRFFRGNRHLTKLPNPRPSNERNSVWKEYKFRGDGVTGTVLRQGKVAFFEDFEVDAAKIPGSLHLKSELLNLLGNETRSDEVELACEHWSVHLHFEGGKLSRVTLHDARRSYD